MVMTRRSHHLACVAFVLWLLSSWLGAHSHFCFDGQEPPVSVHMHLLDSHVEHHADEEHQDTDVDWLPSAIAKLSKLDQNLLLLTVAALLLVLLQPRLMLGNNYVVAIPARTPFINPPLRAPPTPA